MKNSLTFVLVFAFSIVLAQEYDSSFADDGVLILQMPIIEILEDDQNIYFKGNSEIMSVTLDGSLRREFGTDGLINMPFGNISQHVSDFVFYDNKLVLLGSGSSFSDPDDIYINQLDLESGDHISELIYQNPDSSKQYMRSYFFDSEIHLFGSNVPITLDDGSSNSDLYNRFELTYNPADNVLSSVRGDQLDPNNIEPLIPFDFFPLSDGRILVDCLTKHFSNPQIKIINDITEIATLDSAESLPPNSLQFTINRFVEIEPLNILSLRFNFEESYLLKMNLSDNEVDTVALDFLVDDFRLFSMSKYDDASFLLFGYKTIEDKADRLIVYSVKNNFELNQDFGDNGIMELVPQLNGNTIRGLVSKNTEKHVYLRILTEEVRGSSNLIRFKKPLTSVADIQTDELTIYPIPASEVLFISGNEDNPNATYQIHNLAGLKVKEGKLNNNQVDIKSIGSGIFYLTLRNKEGLLVHKSFIVE